MKISFYLLVFLLTSFSVVRAQSPVGKWKKISHVATYDGTKFDSHKALLKSRPCAAKIIYEINADGTYRLNASQSGCDAKYINIQEKLHSEEVWSVKGNTITIGHEKAPEVGHTYTFTIKGNMMTWVGTDGQGTLVFQRLP